MRCWLILVALCLPMSALAHGGGLDSSGCHTNHKTGDYHCHRSSYTPPTSPAPSSGGEKSSYGGLERQRRDSTKKPDTMRLW